MPDLLRKVKTNVVKRLASSHIAGATLDDALTLCHRASFHGWNITLCPWGSDDETPLTMSEHYQRTLRSLNAAQFNGALSVKLPSLEYHKELIDPLIDIARSDDIQMRFDAQDPENASQILEMVENISSKYKNIWCTVPSRWQRSKIDAERLIGMQIGARIVKGQWPNGGGAAERSAEKFLELVDIFAGRARHVAIATHDRHLALEALRRLKKAGTPCELEQMLGLPSHAPDISKMLNIPMRLYIPYGHAYLPYNSSDVMHRPAIAAWLARDFFLTRKVKLSLML